MSAGYRKAITYTNLNPGAYKLKIRSSEEYSGKESICKEIDIIVKPPFINLLGHIVFMLLLL